MGSKWKKVKMALGLNLCAFVPANHFAGDDPDDVSSPSSELRPAATIPARTPEDSPSAPPTPGSIKMRLSKSLNRASSKKNCAICLASVQRGNQAIFTAECSHTFHFQCIASNVKHGNRNCPVCRAKWKEIPSQGHSLDPLMGRSRVNPIDWPYNNDRMINIQQHPPRLNSSRNASPLFHSPEPAVFDDDESLNLEIETASTERNVADKSSDNGVDQRQVVINSYKEVSAVPQSSTVDSFIVLLHLKAPCSNSWRNFGRNDAKSPQISQLPRAPVDLVTVLDISGSMSGTKLALLKRAMGFVIQNLGPNDRLAVIAFSSSARRLFPLCRMSETGRYKALQAVNSLVASGGTNIGDGLRKGAKIMEERREKNSVASIILLSDGQDTYSINDSGGNWNQPNYGSLLPFSIHPEESSGFKIPVHTFGFGTDHDASSMHSISEISGGTFSFIETVGAIQDAFAQCIGGLLSVVAKNLQVKIECIHPTVYLESIKAGSYPNGVSSNHQTGSIDAGDLYADEERNFLVSVNIPAETSSNKTSLLKISCRYNDPFNKETVTLEDHEVRIERTKTARQGTFSIEVDRQRNRIRAADAIAQARTAAERGDLTGAISTLDNCRKLLSETMSAKSQDSLCVALDAELKEMQERMASRRLYEESGRAYILSGLSSHSWQRATARGDSTDGLSHTQAYQTPSMVEMVTRSQATLKSGSSTQRRLRPTWSFASRPNPR